LLPLDYAEAYREHYVAAVTTLSFNHILPNLTMTLDL